MFEYDYCPICGERHCYHTWEDMQAAYRRIQQRRDAGRRREEYAKLLATLKKAKGDA